MPTRNRNQVILGGEEPLHPHEEGEDTEEMTDEGVTTGVDTTPEAMTEEVDMMIDEGDMMIEEEDDLMTEGAVMMIDEAVMIEGEVLQDTMIEETIVELNTVGEDTKTITIKTEPMPENLGIS